MSKRERLIGWMLRERKANQLVELVNRGRKVFESTLHPLLLFTENQLKQSIKNKKKHLILPCWSIITLEEEKKVFYMKCLVYRGKPLNWMICHHSAFALLSVVAGNQEAAVDQWYGKNTETINSAMISLPWLPWLISGLLQWITFLLPTPGFKSQLPILSSGGVLGTLSTDHQGLGDI